MTDDKHKLVKNLRVRAEELGFAAFGIAAGRLPDGVGERLRQWLDEGRHGDMLWMADRAGQRSQPAALWEPVRSVIVLGMSYAPGSDPFALEANAAAGRISVYAQGSDYHKSVKKALRQLARWLCDATGGDARIFVDTAPVMEKPLAEAAGLGWQGKHTNMVSRAHGSWLFLGAIYTDLDLPASKAGRDLCGSCRACQDVCPTDAFPAPYRLDARRCISYLTIEHKGPIPHALRPGIGNHVYGCDDCLAVCPWNKFAKSAAANRAFLPRAELAAPRLADLLALDDAGFREIFSGSPVKRTGRDRMARNALIAAGNSGDAALVEQVAALLDDAVPIVRGAAVWALARLDPDRFGAERTARMAAETDPSVLAEWRQECPMRADKA